MEMIKKMVRFVVLASLLSGCAATEPMQDEPRTGVRKVGVVSLIKDEFLFTKIGLTLLNNDEFARDISGWQLNTLATQTTLDALRQDGATIKPVALPVEQALLAKLYRQRGEFGSYVNINRIKGDLKAMVKNDPVDRIVLIHSEQVQDPIQRTSINLYGTGLYYRVTPFDEEPYIKPYSFLRVMVLDGKTLKPISHRLVKCISKNYGRMPLYWDEEIRTNLPTAQWSKLETEIKLMITTNINATLKEISF